MEAQGLAEGNLRNSHRETHAIRRKNAPAKLQQRAYALVESCSPDLVIRQRLDPEKSEGLLKKAPFYVLETTGRGSPGFLVLLPGQPAVFLQLRKGRDPMACTLRMRVSMTVTEGGGSVLIATLDDVLHSLRLEDVWMWRGESIFTREPFSKRRGFLKEFVERHWVPDARLLGGIYTTVAAPMSMEAFSAKKTWDQVANVEFIPETPGKRRMFIMLEEIQRAAVGPAAEKKFRTLPTAVGPAAPAAPSVPSVPSVTTVPTVPSVNPVNATVPITKERIAKAIAVDKLPDVYDLFDEAGHPICRASVQQFSLSQKLRGLAPTLVNIRWRPEFGGYEILSIATSFQNN